MASSSKSSTSTAFYKGMPITQTDKSTGSIMDTARPSQPPYGSSLNRQIGPQSKTGFGRNRDDEKAS